VDTLIPASTHVDTLIPASPHARTRPVLGFDFVDDVSIDATVDRLLAPQPDDGRLVVDAHPPAQLLTGRPRP
jgi:hypothetical protein